MDPPTSPHPFQQGMHHQDQIQRVVSPANQTAMSHYQTQSYANYEQYHRSDTEAAQHDSRQQVTVPSDEALLILRCPRNGMFVDNQCNFQLRINEDCTAIRRSMDLKPVTTCVRPSHGVCKF